MKNFGDELKLCVDDCSSGYLFNSICVDKCPDGTKAVG